MSSKFVNAIGLRQVMRGFDDLTDQIGGDTVYLVGSNVQYSVYVEFGTSKMQAQPYLRPAVDDVMGRKADTIANESASAAELVTRLALEIEREAAQRAPVDTGTLKASIRAERIQ